MARTIDKPPPRRGTAGRRVSTERKEGEIYYRSTKGDVVHGSSRSSTDRNNDVANLPTVAAFPSTSVVSVNNKATCSTAVKSKEKRAKMGATTDESFDYSYYDEFAAATNGPLAKVIVATNPSRQQPRPSAESNESTVPVSLEDRIAVLLEENATLRQSLALRDDEIKAATDKHDAAITLSTRQHETEMEATTLDHQKEMGSLKEQFEQTMANLREIHQQQLNEVQEQCRLSLLERDRTHRESLEALRIKMQQNCLLIKLESPDNLLQVAEETVKAWDSAVQSATCPSSPTPPPPPPRVANTNKMEQKTLFDTHLTHALDELTQSQSNGDSVARKRPSASACPTYGGAPLTSCKRHRSTITYVVRSPSFSSNSSAS